jgi:hypothetical protein
MPQRDGNVRIGPLAGPPQAISNDAEPCGPTEQQSRANQQHHPVGIADIWRAGIPEAITKIGHCRSSFARYACNSDLRSSRPANNCAVKAGRVAGLLECSGEVAAAEETEKCPSGDTKICDMAAPHLLTQLIRTRCAGQLCRGRFVASKLRRNNIGGPVLHRCLNTYSNMAFGWKRSAYSAGLTPRSRAIVSTVSRCSSIAAANSAPFPGLITVPPTASLSAMVLSAAASISAAI